MNVEVRYFSRGGNTKRLADAIAGAAGTKAETVDVPLGQKADLLFLGGSVYGGGIDDRLAAFIDTLTPETVGRVAVFSTAAIKTSAYPQIKKLLDAKGIPADKKEFHCRGQFTLLHRGHPNQKDLDKAAEFTKEMQAHV